jgi:hypothetical protein
MEASPIRLVIYFCLLEYKIVKFSGGCVVSTKRIACGVVCVELDRELDLVAWLEERERSCV